MRPPLLIAVVMCGPVAAAAEAPPDQEVGDDYGEIGEDYTEIGGDE